jgi:sec-independent protein translocase protein TatC
MDEEDLDQPQTLIAHLTELRDRILRCLISIFIIFLFLFPFANEIYEFVSLPLRNLLPEGTSMIATEVASPFLTPFKLSMLSSLYLAMPYILFQTWRFIAPGMYLTEQRIAVPILSSSIILFYAGTAFAYFVVFPLVFGFFTNVAPDGIEIMTDINRYLDFVLKLFFAFGISFEIPVVAIILILTGVTTADRLASKRPFILVGCFVVGMLLTPPDVISQSLLAIPMWILFELGIFLARRIEPSRDKKDPSD